jgi:hypothetical protein
LAVLTEDVLEDGMIVIVPDFFARMIETLHHHRQVGHNIVGVDDSRV